MSTRGRRSAVASCGCLCHCHPNTDAIPLHIDVVLMLVYCTVVTTETVLFYKNVEGEELGNHGRTKRFVHFAFFAHGFGLGLEPLKCSTTAPGRHHLPDFGMVVVEPFDLFCCQKAQVQQLDLNGDKRELLETQVRNSSKASGGVCFLYNYQILYPNTKCTVLVISWFVAEDHVGYNSCLIAIPRAYTLGALMDVQSRTNSMTSSVPII
mmetsp:Transcript_565/g.3992  ORF Transcript_565/g.3992 Transcript_565/m.3992 type:complete len:209 (+) Transcript_565:701-1327(+)